MAPMRVGATVVSATCWAGTSSVNTMFGSRLHNALRSAGSAAAAGIVVRTTKPIGLRRAGGNVQIGPRRFADRANLVIARDADDLEWVACANPDDPADCRSVGPELSAPSFR